MLKFPAAHGPKGGGGEATRQKKGEQSFKNYKIEILQSAQNDPKPNSRNRTSKVTIYCSIPTPKFVSVSLYDYPFSRQSTF